MLFARQASKTLSKPFHFRSHVGKAAYPIGRVTASENPDGVIRLRALPVPHCAERLVTRKALQAYLCREHVLRCFSSRPCRRSEQATA